MLGNHEVLFVLVHWRNGKNDVEKKSIKGEWKRGRVVDNKPLNYLIIIPKSYYTKLNELCALLLYTTTLQFFNPLPLPFFCWTGCLSGFCYNLSEIQQ